MSNADEVDIRELIAGRVAAINAGDVDQVTASLSSEVVTFDMVGTLRDGVSANAREGLKGRLALYADGPFWKDQDVTIAAGGDVAFAYMLDLRGDLDLQTTHQAWGMLPGVFDTFRRRLDAHEALAIGDGTAAPAPRGLRAGLAPRAGTSGVCGAGGTGSGSHGLSSRSSACPARLHLDSRRSLTQEPKNNLFPKLIFPFPLRRCAPES